MTTDVDPAVRQGRSAKDEILSRIRAATPDVTSPVGARGAAPRVEQPASSRAETVELFVENVEDYKAAVVRVAPDGIAQAVADAVRDVGSVVVPGGLDAAYLSAWPGAVRRVSDDGLSSADLDAIDGVVTTASVGIATTGTIVLDHGPGMGRRALSLVPDLHVCIVRTSQVVHDVPEAVARLAPGAVTGGGHVGPQTWISGPSATSDIELDRVEGVHGPRTLHVIVVDDE